MASYNRVILIGNITRDIELRYVQSGTAVTDVTVAVNDRRKTATGDWIEETTFVDVTFWGRQAEIASQYLSKGSPILVEGRLKLDQWEANDGQKRSRLRVVGERMQMLGSRPGGGGNSGAGNSSAGAGRAEGQGQGSQGFQHRDSDEPHMAGAPEDDIPF